MQVRSQGEYFGDQRWVLAQKGINLSEYNYVDPGTPWHYHENPYFMYVIEGKMMDINKRKKSQLASGSLMFLNWEETHRSTKESNRGRGFHLQMDRSWLKANDLNENLWEGSAKLENPATHHQLAKIYHEFRQSDGFSAVAVEALVLELCSALNKSANIPSMSTSYSGSPTEPNWMSRLLEMIHDGSQEITLSLLSEELSVHPVHISRTVPAVLGTTLGEYLRKEKVKKSFPLLLNEAMSLSDIAYDCQFSDQSHFIRTFKKYHGLTPGLFRKSMGASLSLKS